MQEVFIITPVTDLHRLASIYQSMEHVEPVLFHWFVVFDLEHARYYNTWKGTFDYGQVERVNVHCLLSDRHKPVSDSHYNRNLALDTIEGHVITEQPSRKECWVYQLEDSNDLHPAFAAFVHNNQFEIKKYDLIVFDGIMPAEMQIATEGLASYAFRASRILGLRHSDTRNDFLTRLVNRCAGRIMFAPEKVYKKANVL